MKFELGQVVTTAGVYGLIKEDDKFLDFVNDSLRRYCECDWGSLCEDDAKLNDEAVRLNNDRILAAYEKEGLPKIWIITEYDRSATTILFPDEY